MKSANKTSAPVAAAGIVTVTAKHGNSADLQPPSLTPLRRGKSSGPGKGSRLKSLIYRKNTKRGKAECDSIHDKCVAKMKVFEQAGTDCFGLGDFAEDVSAWVARSVFETTRNQGLSEEAHSLDHLELGLLAD